MRRHAPDVFCQAYFAEGVDEAVRRRGLFQVGKLFADVAQARRVCAHAQRHPLARAKEVGKDGVIVTAAVGGDDVFKEQRLPALRKDAARDFADF